MQQIKTRSGTTRKNEIFERIEDSMIVAEKRINVLISNDFTIILPPFCHLIVFDLQQLHFQVLQNRLLELIQYSGRSYNRDL